MASLYKRNGVWFAIFTVRYKQKWIRVGRMSKTAASEVLKKLEQDRDKKKFGIMDEKHIPFEDYAKEYLTFSKANKAKESYRRDSISMKNLLSYFNVII